MAQAQMTLKFQVDFTDVIRQLREAADRLERMQQAEAEPSPGLTEQHADPDLIGTDIQGPDLH